MQDSGVEKQRTKTKSILKTPFPKHESSSGDTLNAPGQTQNVRAALAGVTA